MPTSLHERLLFIEARIALAEDRLDVMKRHTRFLMRCVLGWIQWALVVGAIKLFAHFAPELKEKR